MQDRWLICLACSATYLFHAVEAGGGKEENGPELIQIPARSFTMGGEALSGAPKTKEISLQNYKLHDTPVTNRDFRRFVKATKYKTEAEVFGWSFVLNASLSSAVLEESDQHVDGAAHWVAVAGAYWRRPEGRDSNLEGRWDDYPAVHISWNDAKAYCEWADLRLPTEAEWENAARGRRNASIYAWGHGDSAMAPDGNWMMNIWQGSFPQTNDASDGYEGISPNKAFPPNSYGLYAMVGNVWEWTSDYWPNQRNPQEMQVTLKGGSFIDSIDGSFNHKATVVTRMGNTADSGSYNTGFRCASGKGGGGRTPPPKEEELQKILEEGGVEALQSHLGDKAKIMTPQQLQESQKTRKAKHEAPAEL